VTVIARSKGFSKLGASLPEDGSRAGFRNVVLLNLTRGEVHKKEIESVSGYIGQQVLQLCNMKGSELFNTAALYLWEWSIGILC